MLLLRLKQIKKSLLYLFDEARLKALRRATIQQAKEVSAPKLSEANTLPDQAAPQSLPTPDPKAEDWASKNSWFGKDRAMTLYSL